MLCTPFFESLCYCALMLCLVLCFFPLVAPFFFLFSSFLQLVFGPRVVELGSKSLALVYGLPLLCISTNWLSYLTYLIYGWWSVAVAVAVVVDAGIRGEDTRQTRLTRHEVYLGLDRDLRATLGGRPRIAALASYAIDVDIRSSIGNTCLVPVAGGNMGREGKGRGGMWG